MTTEHDAVIEIDHVTKVFGDFVAVDDAHFTINQGEFFAMLGPSGCGKTTTLRMIAGFESPTSGAVRLEGHEVSKIPPYKRNVNTVFQQYALFPNMTVRENIEFGPRTKKLAKAEIARRVDEMLEIVRLGDFASRKPAQLSGGQQQRVALARALVNYPSALLLDEPLAALDLKLRQAMQIELKRIQREVGITFIFVTHDQEEALTLSDRIAVMNAGTVEQIGTPEMIYDQPATAFVAGFIGQANTWSATITATNGDRADATIGDLRISGRTQGNVQTGDAAVFMVRPERVHIQIDQPAAPTIAMPCTVIDSVFQGPVVRFALRSPDNTEVVAYVNADQQLPLLRPGDAVWACWEPDAARLIPVQSAEMATQEDSHSVSISTGS